MDFAFLIHSRDYRDIAHKYPIAKYFPRWLIEFWCLHWPPLLITKLKNIQFGHNEPMNGYVIGIPMTAHQIMERRVLSRQKVVRAINYAEKLGAKIVGLGALTSSITGGGALIKNNIKIPITSGQAYTGFIVSSYVLEAIKIFGLEKERVNVAIVGAAGTVGSTCARILAQKGITNFLLVDLGRKLEKIEKLMQSISLKEKSLSIKITHQVSDVKTADIIVTATNSPEAIIKPDDLKKGAIIIDDAQPTDISPEVRKQRDDVIVIDGGVVSAPGVENNFNFGLANKNEVFSCMAEAMILATQKTIPQYEINAIPMELIERISNKGKELGLDIAKFQRFGHEYSEMQIKRFRKIISEKSE